MTNRQLFLNHLAQTSPSPLALEIVKAKGCKLWDIKDNEYLDLIGGISVCNIGHCHPKVTEAIKNQLNNYLHVMVYGELVLSPQTAYAKLLTDHLPPALNAVFFTASGSEATEGAMKLAKRYTGRNQIVSFKDSYHGSTHGSLSVMGNEYYKNAFRPLLPGVLHLNFNCFEDLQMITEQTACVIAETIQAEAGVIVPQDNWLNALKHKCDEAGALLILDEIQCGFGRNGTLWAFEQFGIVPHILLLGKALGGGMPMGAFISDKKIMDSLASSPVLGHINTFGGHPLCCAAGFAGMRVLLDESVIEKVKEKENLFLALLKHARIKSIRSRGLMIAVQLESFDQNKKVIDGLLNVSQHLDSGESLPGVFTDWFLFAPDCLRIAPPLTISEAEIELACKIIISALNDL